MSEPLRTILRRDAPMRRATLPTGGTTSVGQPTTVIVGVPQKSPRRWKRLLVVAVACATIVVYFGQQRRPIGPSAGPYSADSSQAGAAGMAPWHNDSVRIRLGTYNIHGGRGTDGKRDLGRIADMLRGVDFVGLNEVHGPALYETHDQATLLARELKMTPIFAPTEERWWHLKFGNGFLSKLTVDHWQVVPLARRYGKSYRNYVHVRARASSGPAINILVAHIDRSDDRERHEQLRTVANQFLALEPPAVLMGDLNSDSSDDEIVRLLGTTGVVDALGKKYGLKKPRHIDWIFVRGCEVVDAGITGAGPSDHPHVWADVSLPGANFTTLGDWNYRPETPR